MPLMREKKLTTRTGWLTAEGLRAGHAESFAAGYQQATMAMKITPSWPTHLEHIEVTATFSVDSTLTARYSADQVNLARKTFVLVCKVMDPTYKHEPVLL